jgi:hypothetical protein
MTLGLHHRIALGHIAHFTAIASAFQTHDDLPIVVRCGRYFCAGSPEWKSFSSPSRAKRKGLQLALEPLNGRGIAGYVPKP